MARITCDSYLIGLQCVGWTTFVIANQPTQLAGVEVVVDI